MLVDAGAKSLSISPYTYYVMSKEDVKKKTATSASVNSQAHTHPDAFHRDTLPV